LPPLHEDPADDDAAAAPAPPQVDRLLEVARVLAPAPRLVAPAPRRVLPRRVARPAPPLLAPAPPLLAPAPPPFAPAPPPFAPAPPPFAPAPPLLAPAAGAPSLLVAPPLLAEPPPSYATLRDVLPAYLLVDLDFDKLDAVFKRIRERYRHRGTRINGGCEQFMYKTLQDLFEKEGETKLFDAMVRVIEYRLLQGARDIKLGFNSAEGPEFTYAHDMWSFLFSFDDVRQQDFHSDVARGFCQTIVTLSSKAAGTLVINPGAPIELAFADNMRDVMRQVSITLPTGYEGLDFMSRCLV
jgi:hypothetical protein